MQSIFDNLINGNLQAAKKSAKRKSLGILHNFAAVHMGWKHAVALSAAQYLKGQITFQDYCNVSFANK
jgi:hypothetical protein